MKKPTGHPRRDRPSSKPWTPRPSSPCPLAWGRAPDSGHHRRTRRLMLCSPPRWQLGGFALWEHSICVSTLLLLPSPSNPSDLPPASPLQPHLHPACSPSRGRRQESRKALQRQMTQKGAQGVGGGIDAVQEPSQAMCWGHGAAS